MYESTKAWADYINSISVFSLDRMHKAYGQVYVVNNGKVTHQTIEPNKKA